MAWETLIARNASGVATANRSAEIPGAVVTVVITLRVMSSP
jgi:hypothetical protein